MGRSFTEKPTASRAIRLDIEKLQMEERASKYLYIGTLHMNNSRSVALESNEINMYIESRTEAL